VISETSGGNRKLKVRLQQMAQAGLILWSGRKLEPRPPVAQTRGTQTVADLMVEDRI